MANSSHVAVLKKGAQPWNDWRKANWNIKPDLSGLDLTNVRALKKSSLWDASARQVNLADVNLAAADVSDVKFKNVNLSAAILVDANLVSADLSGCNLTSADMSGADMTRSKLESALCVGAQLQGAVLHKADLWLANLNAANLAGADLEDADLTRANLHKADLTEANLAHVNLHEADLRASNLDHAGVVGIKYSRRNMRGKYQGVRGIESTFGDAIFRRDALDQDYYDTLASRWRKTPKMFVHWLWSQLDYGRSFARIGAAGALVVFGFGLVYQLDPSLMEIHVRIDPWLAPYLSSLFAVTSLGLLDLVSAKSSTGEILYVAQIAIGYVTYGALLAILLQKIARRS